MTDENKNTDAKATTKAETTAKAAPKAKAKPKVKTKPKAVAKSTAKPVEDAPYLKKTAKLNHLILNQQNANLLLQWYYC